MARKNRYVNVYKTWGCVTIDRIKHHYTIYVYALTLKDAVLILKEKSSKGEWNTTHSISLHTNRSYNRIAGTIIRDKRITA